MNWMLLPNYKYIENILGQSRACFLNGGSALFLGDQALFNYEICVIM